VKHILLTLILLGVTNFLAAQSRPVLYDADGFRLGELAYVNNSITTISSSDGSLIAFDAETGFLTKSRNGFFYESFDCSGQAYVDGSDTDPLTGIGGHIFRVTHSNFPATPTFAVSPWGAAMRRTTILIFGEGKPNACTPKEAIQQISNYIPVKLIDPAIYGLKQIIGSQWGIKGPVDVQLDTADIISCDGFESCPVDNP
jgi:hypothetical protein